MTDTLVGSDDGDDKSWKEFRAAIRERLNEHRPDRVGAGETEWREKDYAWARNHMPDESRLVRVVAKQEVDRQEALATRKGNDILRRYIQGESPLEWALLGPYPITIDGLRIRWDAATPDDADDAAREYLDDSKRRYDKEVVLGHGMQDLSRKARREGHSKVAQIGDQPILPFDVE